MPQAKLGIMLPIFGRIACRKALLAGGSEPTAATVPMYMLEPI